MARSHVAAGGRDVSAVVLDVVEPNLVLVPAPDAVRRIELQREAEQDGVGLADTCM